MLILGATMGAVSRFYIYELLKNKTAFYIPTLFVNVVGSFLLGLFLQYGSQQFYTFIAIGFLGSFTTFSTFSVDTLKLLLAGNVKLCIANIILNVVTCMFACTIGLHI